MNHNGNRVGLFRSRAPGAPDREAPVRSRLRLEHGQELVLESAELPVLAKKVRFVRRQEIDGLVPFFVRTRAETQVMVVVGEAEKLQNDQTLAQATLQSETRFGPKIEPGARREEISEQPELIRLERNPISERRSPAHYFPALEPCGRLVGSAQSDVRAPSP